MSRCDTTTASRKWIKTEKYLPEGTDIPIGGMWYRVVLRDRIEDNGRLAWGLTDNEELLIYLREEFPTVEVLWETVRHEVIEAAKVQLVIDISHDDLERISQATTAADMVFIHATDKAK